MQIYKVGGAVRDRLLGQPVTDVDWVVVGATGDEMLVKGYRPVGTDFPVFLHPLTGEEYALARTERKSGVGYGGFVFHASPQVTLEQDLIRRDLTINAIAEDKDGNLTDPYGGQRDLEARILRHVSPAFAEDPLRVLRVARFAARYAGRGFKVAPETLALMRQLSESGELKALTPERCWKEISRALMEAHPDVFIGVLHECGALKQLLPEVEALFNTGTGEHVLSTLHLSARHQQPLSVRWACLLHDLSLRAVKAINERLRTPRECQELAQLTGQHLAHGHQALTLEPSAVLELLHSFDVYRRPQRFEEFIAACEMDARARPEQHAEPYPQAAYLQGAANIARNVRVQPLLEQGLKGQDLGNALKDARLEALKAYKASTT